MNSFIVYKVIPHEEIVGAAVIFLGGIILFIIGFYKIACYLKCKINPQKHILMILTPEALIFPGWKYFIVSNPERIIPWKDITKIHLEDYSERKRRYGKRVYKKLYFYSAHPHTFYKAENDIDTVNSEYIDMPLLEFFIEIKQYYHGPIIKEYARKKFQILESNKNGNFVWENVEPSIFKSR